MAGALQSIVQPMLDSTITSVALGDLLQLVLSSLTPVRRHRAGRARPRRQADPLRGAVHGQPRPRLAARPRHHPPREHPSPHRTSQGATPPCLTPSSAAARSSTAPAPRRSPATSASATAASWPSASWSTRPREEIDANGAIVTPGFFDLHTHYDGQVTWDDALEPSATNGITTIVLGNCGVGFAPVRPEDHDSLIDMMEGVEDIPGSALSVGMPWGRWETFAEYLDLIDEGTYAANVACHIAHGPLRFYVMGERAYEDRDATAEEVAEMARLVREAFDAGAAGFSTNRFRAHMSRSGKIVPGTFAPAEELVGHRRRGGRGRPRRAPGDRRRHHHAGRGHRRHARAGPARRAVDRGGPTPHLQHLPGEAGLRRVPPRPRRHRGVERRRARSSARRSSPARSR